MAAEFIRVADKVTGHEFTIRANRYDAKAHTKVDKPALDAHGDPAAPKYRTTVAKKAAEKKAAAPADPADTHKEN